MHAAVLADQPFKLLVLWINPLGVPHDRERCGRQVERIVVNTVIEPDLLLHVVPLKARDLACLAADAFRDVDEFRHWRELFRRCRDIRRRAPDEIFLAELHLHVGGGRGGKNVFEISHRSLPSL